LPNGNISEVPRTSNLGEIYNGREEGEKAGMEKALRETARSRLADGMNPALIAQFIDLSVEEIETLYRSN
jgi:hypothetical protein